MTVEELLEQYAAGVINFTGVNLSEASLSGVKLSGVNLSSSDLSIVNFSGSNLSGANLSNVKLNVARLRGANLEKAILNNSSLNVANLIRANLNGAQLRGASLVRAELIRADLTSADLFEANLKNADLREATLRQTNLRHANLSTANFRGSSLVGANLEMANLNTTDLSRSDLSGANMRDADLKQANLNQANLSGADLSGANLRWADLSGANLRWADLSGAKLSGADLSGADLTNANLTNTSLVHADLTQATLMKVEWSGADLTGAILTGSKLYSTFRFGLKTEGITCEWVDLSPKGDRSIIQKFTGEDARDFFNETAPTIRIVIDAPLEHEANFALAGSYYQIAQEYQGLKQPPTLEISRRRTVLTFRVDNDLALLPTAYIAILPFQDATNTQKNISAILKILQQEDISRLGLKAPHKTQQLSPLVDEAITQAQIIKKMKKNLELAAKLNFYKVPTQTILTNSSAQTLIVYDHPLFGKRFINSSGSDVKFLPNISRKSAELAPETLNMVVDFINGFHYIS
ncbi:pentapeptide repeat-containing protein [Nodularia harveyana UHCC-0300]|uniref:Pentapeptide repeat-containing protein n=1 Tax=Nodularia harveyana UHCC-0300 TaxID=2974287 RepID=A0ABU5UF53_9CYAN|nr:pentapeptide repeat-containing protein [Nodularia harveyana]MEA5581928.1 pentapeptide repeat-containing protein [Nodularia harveyana UHCC-0300]